MFPATHWSAVMSAGAGDGAERALEVLATAYWKPLYHFVRQRGRDHDDAADAVQGFFVHLLRQDSLSRVEVRETRFRTFLLAMFKNWLATDFARAGAQKRGGAVVIVPLAEFETLSGVWCPRVGEDGSIDESFDWAWARNIFERAVAAVRATYQEQRRELCDQLVASVVGGGRPPRIWRRSSA